VLPANLPAPRSTEIQVSEAVPEIEQAKVLLRFGHIEDAASSLAALSSNPAERAESLLRARSRAGNDETQAAITGLADATRLFNVDFAGERHPGDADPSLEDYPHIIKEIVARWPERSCAVYLDCLLLDSRSGNRAGFPAAVAAEIILLRRLHDQRSQRSPGEPALRVVRGARQRVA
jgi:hypothetical protein